MRTVAWVGGVVIVAGLIVMAVAGFPGAVPILVSAAALVAMIGLGGAMGGRHTPNVPPVTTGPPVDGPPIAEPPVVTPPGGDGEGVTGAAGESAGGAAAES
jgi:hypothetical protein